jgi:UDP-N-acetylmuramate--alanine ligase
MDWQTINKIYIIGIEGGGTSALACLLKGLGKTVSGVDEGDHFFNKLLVAKQINVFNKFTADNLPDDVDLIIYSSAFNKDNNVELKAALEKYAEFTDQAGDNIKVIPYTKAIAALFNHYQNNIAVCGTHGKTTVSAWLAFVLEQAGKDPNAIFGAQAMQLGGNHLVGKSDIFVFEADEYQNKLQNYNPHIAVLNNVEYDHPDFFKTAADYQQAFVDFVSRLPQVGKLIVNVDDAGAKAVSAQCNCEVLSYSFNSEAKYQIQAVKYNDAETNLGKQSFVLGDLGKFEIALVGKHNIANAAAVILAAKELGMAIPEINKHLVNFTGTERRLQKIGEYNGITILDDFAHHPTEIRATLDGVKQLYPNKNIVAVFHPHTFTRTKALFDDFAKSFELLQENDELIILDIYGSAREQQGGVSSQELVTRVSEVNKNINSVQNIHDLQACEGYLRNKLKPGDLLLLLGAGDLWKIGENLLAEK